MESTGRTLKDELLEEITAFQKAPLGCVAGDEYFAKILGASAHAVHRELRELEAAGQVSLEYRKTRIGGEIRTKRSIKLLKHTERSGPIDRSKDPSLTKIVPEYNE